MWVANLRVFFMFEFVSCSSSKKHLIQMMAGKGLGWRRLVYCAGNWMCFKLEILFYLTVGLIALIVFEEQEFLSAKGWPENSGSQSRLCEGTGLSHKKFVDSSVPRATCSFLRENHLTKAGALALKHQWLHRSPRCFLQNSRGVRSERQKRQKWQRWQRWQRQRWIHKWNNTFFVSFLQSDMSLC